MIDNLFTSVLPLPKAEDDPNFHTCIWRSKMTVENQKLELYRIHRLMLVYGYMWQSIDQPTRMAESSRAIVAISMLCIFDKILRSPCIGGDNIVSIILRGDLNTSSSPSPTSPNGPNGSANNNTSFQGTTSSSIAHNQNLVDAVAHSAYSGGFYPSTTLSQGAIEFDEMSNLHGCFQQRSHMK